MKNKEPETKFAQNFFPLVSLRLVSASGRGLSWTGQDNKKDYAINNKGFVRFSPSTQHKKSKEKT